MNALAFLVAVIFAFLPAVEAASSFPGRRSTWNGYTRHDFKVDGRACIVVLPRAVAAGRPWVWRARFFGHQPQVDLALLARGYHVVYCDVAELFGSPRAVAHWNRFYTTLTREHGLAKKAALEGMSRGGLIVYNWAAANPEKVACIYGDAPVCDFKSWPRGTGKSEGSAGDWQECLDAYGLSADEALAYRFNPIDQLAALVRANVPILHVIGAADAVVPPAENSAIVAARYRKLGGVIQVISKPGVGHHPHSLPNPRPIVEFMVRSSRVAGADRSVPRDFDGNVVRRGSLANSRLVFERDKQGHVAFMGGSITEMNGYRPLVCDALRAQFPGVEFTFTNAGIASTCSTTGAFRLGDEVLRKGPVDLFFVEFAVNDDQDAQHSRRACVRGMEGIVRQVRRHNPNADIVMVDFVNPGMLDTIQRGKTPLTIAAHEAVARHYAVSSVNLAREVAEEILAGEITWKQYGGTHPARAGNALCARMIAAILDPAWSETVAAQGKAYPQPTPIDPLSYGRGTMIDAACAEIASGWRIEVPDWSHLAGQARARFRGIRALCADQPGAELTLEFHGTLIGVYVLAGPDAGVVSGSIDGTPFSPVNLYHRFSTDLHYPRTVLFAEDLAPGMHRLLLRVAHSTQSDGHAVRIIRFVTNAVGQGSGLEEK
jgi:pimeloyl-ACP methyl ester carboxylesterase/lysophospholipase L1-like esterase